MTEEEDDQLSAADKDNRGKRRGSPHGEKKQQGFLFSHKRGGRGAK